VREADRSFPARTESQNKRTPTATHTYVFVAFRGSSLLFNFSYYVSDCGPGSSVGIATDYGLDGPGIESRWGDDFPPVQTGPGAHPASCTVSTGSFPGAKCGWGVLLTTHPLLMP
jgi:hypothetical protein